MVCRKFIKWVVLPTAAVAGVGYLALGHGLGSYISTAWSDATNAVRGSVPVDFELRRAQTLLEKIDPEIREARKEAIRAEIDLEQLDKQIRGLESSVAKCESKMQRHRAFVDGDGQAVTVFHGSREYGVAAVKAELARSFDAYRNQVELLEGKKNQRSRQAKILSNAKSKLLAVRAERERLQDAIGSLEARKRQIDALAASSTKTSEFDTSSLSEAKKLVADITRRLDISERMIKEDLYLQTGEEPVVGADNRDIVREIDDYFAGRLPESTRQRETTESNRLVKIAK
ncbi:MAG: hypothetical protein KDC95_06965 [Planctomycetes bacterium]|nr:hypothetical protein [Planctomycetota bacterium]